MPTEEQGSDRCYKLPYMSSEMLAIDNKIFYDAFFPSESEKTASIHLENLFKFLKNKEAIENPLLLGYFSKVTSNLYKGKKLEFTKSVSSYVKHFAEHLDK